MTFPPGLLFRAFLCLVLHGVFFLPGHAAPLLGHHGQVDRFTLKSTNGECEYVIEVWLPQSYVRGDERYPLLLMLDGEYAFHSAVQISDYLQRNGETNAYIVAAVSYGVGFGAPLAVHRTRDFTPPVDERGIITRSDTAYYNFLKNVLLPQLQSTYRIDPANRALWGYSLSASFAAWLNLHDPSLFEHYILASGNLMGFGIAQSLFQGKLFSTPGLGDRRVMISFDRSEVPDPKILEDGQRLLAQEGAFPGHTMTLHLTQGETHASAWFVALPMSLRYVFGRASSVGTVSPHP